MSSGVIGVRWTFSGNRGTASISSPAMAREHLREKKNKRPPLKTKAEKRAERFAKRSGGSRGRSVLPVTVPIEQRPMRILLTKLSDERHALQIVRGDGTCERVELPTREFLFHDLLHYAVESSIGTQEGFWGALARGKTMGDLNDRSGISMQEHSGAMAYIEQAVGMMTGSIKGGVPAEEAITSIRGFHEALGHEMPGWFTESFVDDVRDRMRRLLGRWKATAYGQAMAVEWLS
jgi:hypothetical protein